MSLRRAVAFGLTFSILMLIVAPMAGAKRSESTSKGSATSRLNILSIELTHVPALGTVGAALGLATGDATTVQRPLAQVVLEGLRVGNQTLGSHSVSSDDASPSQDVTVPLSGPGIDGSLTLATLGASATKDSATGVLRGLKGTIAVAPLGISTKLGGQGIISHVDPKISQSTVGVDVGPITLGLGDLLPSELLEALPLKALLNLARSLDLDIAGTLNDAMLVLRGAVANIDDVQAKADELAAAVTSLDALIAGNPQVNAAKQQLTSAAAAYDAAAATASQKQAEIAALTAQRAVIEQAMATCSTNCAALQAQLNTLDAQIQAKQQEVSAAQSAVGTAQSNLAAAQAALDAAVGAADGALQAADALVDQLQAQLNTLLDTLEDLLGNIPNLDTLLEDVIAALQGAPILSIGRLQVGVTAIADRAKGTADAACSVEGVSILGTSIGATSCASLRDQFNQLTDGIFGLLKNLPVVGSVPQPTVDGLVTSEQASSKRDAQGRTSAAASITALRFTIPSLSLEDVVSQLVADLTAKIQELTSSTPLAGTLDQVLATVTQQLAQLPTGELLSGLRTVGVDAKLGGISANSQLTSAATPSTDDPEVKSSTQPKGKAPLAFTGSGYILVALALALWAFVAGAAAHITAQKQHHTVG